MVYLMVGLKDRGHEVVLVCPDGSAIAENAAAAGIEVVPVPLRSDFDLTFICRLHRIIRRRKPDVVHLHSRRGADVLGGIAARTARAPAVILSRRIDNPVRPGFLTRLKYGVLCDRIITISQAIRDVLLDGGVDSSKIACVHSVVDSAQYDVDRDPNLRAELGVPGDSPLIGIVAQLIERKGHRYLLEAMPRIIEAYPDTRLIVLGAGPLADVLKRQAETLGVADGVVFAGFRNDMPQVFRELDVLVHPALMEGLGVAILQAMAAGVPVVASPVGGIPEAVQDGVTGIHVPPANPEAVAEAVCRLLGDPALRARMGAAGRAFVEREFSPARMVEGVLSVYRSVLDAKGAAVSGDL